MNSKRSFSRKKNLSKFGDSFVNFIYSLAKSLTINEYTGKKVSNSCLSQALVKSKIEKPSGADKHEKGDFVEAYIAEAWLENVISIDDCVKILKRELMNFDLKKDEKEATISAFSKLLKEIGGRWNE